MKIEQALILEEISGLAPGKREVSKPWRSPDEVSKFPPEIDYYVEYLARESDHPPAIVVCVQQFPTPAWPLYFAKWSPNPGILRRENPDLVLTRVETFRNKS